MAVLNGFVELPLKKAGLGDISVNINLITDIRVVTNPSNKWVIQVVIAPGTTYTLDLGPFDTKEEALSAKQDLISSFKRVETGEVGKVDWQDIENKPELQEKLIAGTNITIDENNVISASGGIETVDWQDVENKPELYNKTEINSMLGNKVDKTSIVDNLTTNDATKVLSAKQGKVLQDTKEALTNKAVDFSVVNDTKYPTTKAVKDLLDATLGDIEDILDSILGV